MISVLYVDDEPDLLELCKIFLEQTGDFRVDTLETPQDALLLLTKTHYDVIVCDYQMPEIDGISLLKKVRSHCGDIPFILFTGRGREEIVIDALNNGADFYLQKGGDVKAQFAELTSKIRQAVIRRQTEHSLRQSEKTLADIINFLPDATLAIDRSGTVIAWNRAIEDMTGVAAAEMLGTGEYEYAIPFYGTRRPILIDLIFEPEEKIKATYTGIVREKDVLIAETTLPHPRGAMKILMGKASPLYNQMGEIIGAIESIRDITAQKQADDELRAAYEQITSSDEELRMQYEELVRGEIVLRSRDEQLLEITATIPAVVYQFYARPGGIYGMYYVSDRARDILGFEYTVDDFFEKMLAHIHPDYRTSFLDSIAEVVSHPAQWLFEGRFIRPSGETIWLKCVSSPVQHGNELVFSGVILEITERKTAEEARTESEERYRTLAEAAQDLIYIIDKNDLVTYVNSYGLQMMGRGWDEVVGRPRSALFPAPASAQQYHSIQRVFTTGKPLRVESMVPMPGRETWQDTHLVPLKAADGTITSVLGISRDISQLKRAQTALKKSNEKLNLLNSITRHDVANQLTILNGYIQLAMMKEPDAIVGDFLTKIETASDTIQRQIEFTRTYQDLGIQAPDWFGLDQIIEKARPEGVVFTSVCNNFEIFADPMLEKVFFNLFDNAIRHGERVTSMIVRCEPRGDELVIIVEDDGVGIPLDEKQKIFGKGFGKNTGYGLFLVREILAITGIEIHETGRHGSGARFEITVPKNGFRQKAME